MNKNKEHQPDRGGTGERGGQREENRSDNPRRLDHGGEAEQGHKHLDTRELPGQQKEDARRRQESGGRKG
jgi:hypothetical protein